MIKICIIGFGNMGQAFYQGLKNYPKLEISALNRSKEKVIKYGIKLANESDIKSADFIILTIKPQQLSELNLPESKKTTVLISALAGTSFDTLKTNFSNLKIVRCMPNLAIAKNQGVINWCSHEPDTNSEHILSKIFDHLGTSIPLDSEQLLDKSTLISGCGPGYLAHIVSLIEEQAIELGFDAQKAQLLAIKTFIGTAQSFEHDISPKELKKMVSSPNGVTEKMIQSLEQNHLDKILKEAFKSGLNKINNLKK